MSTPPPDDIDALRTITQALESFGADDQMRILRWASEKLGITPVSTPPQTPPTPTPPGSAPLPGTSTPAVPGIPGGRVDIKSFVASKQPKNDTQFAAVVAYFHRFETSPTKESITQEDLQEACRLANYTRLKKPGQTLQNAVRSGLLDNAARGAYSINSVGENLVALTLPSDVSGSAPRKRPIRKPTPKNAVAKPAAKKAVNKAVAKKK